MDNGEVIEEGSHEALVRNGGWYAEQFERQQGESESTDSGVKI
jgi:ABC-type multidrug transport system fused ATPase/permease subunit